MQLALVDTLLPVYVEDAFGDGSDLVDVVGIRCDDPDAYEIGDVAYGFVLGSFQLKFPCERCLGLDSVLDGCDVDALLG